jgi:hypothetical protein
MSNPFADDEEVDNPFAADDPPQTSFHPDPPSQHDAPAAAAFSAPAPAPSKSPSLAPSLPPAIGGLSLSVGPGDFRDPVTGMVITKAQMDQRERELAKREAEISGFETQVANGTFVRSKEKNFPPYLHWWSWHPDRDLPADLVAPMKRLRWLFLGCVGALFINAIGCLTLLDGVISSPGTSVILSLVYLIVLSPLSFELAFFPLYKALARAKAIKFFTSLFMFLVWFGFLAFCLIGVIGTGGCGFWLMFTVFGKSTTTGVIALLFCIVGTPIAVLMAMSLIWLFRYYKTNGLAEKAMQEGANAAANYAKEHPEQAMDAAKFAAANPDAAAAIAGVA